MQGGRSFSGTDIDDMRPMMNIAKEPCFDMCSFHHAVEAYIIHDLLTEHGISASMWSDRWGFKMEAYDGIPQNVALMETAGGPPRQALQELFEEGLVRLGEYESSTRCYSVAL